MKSAKFLRFFSAKVIIEITLAFVAILAFLYLLGFDLRTGAPAESSFMLSSDSRMPQWFDIPEGYETKDLTVEIFYYSSLGTLPNLKATLISISENKVLETKYGNTKDFSSVVDYPIFAEGTIDGISEIIEHKAMEPIFYISDSYQ